MDVRLDPIFHEDSYGYRPRRSAHQALQRCAERCLWRGWALEVDIRAFFDNVSHDLVLRALQHHDMPRWVLLYANAGYGRH